MIADEFIRLEASARVHADPDRVADVLRGEIGRWLPGAVVRAEVPGMRRASVDLRLHVGGEGAGLTTFRKAALLDLGRVRTRPPGYEVKISWRSAGAAPLFPVFSGWLIVQPSELRIEGIYAPPGGPVGRVADRVLLHVAANATARWVLRELDRAALGSAA
jgi:hypothetical protein